MKKIGFVDYYMSEWHANNYPQWIKEANERLGLDYQLSYAWAEEDVSPRDGITTDDWCKSFGVTRCRTLEELCEKSDVIVVLAPANPETHLRYAQKVLQYGKRTYIDKTFAPDFATAKEIFAVGKEYGAPFFSTSALRYATELDECENCCQIVVTGSGSSLVEYVIHLVEMVVKKLGTGAQSVKVEQIGAQTFMHVRYGDDRAASMIFARSMPYTAYMASVGENRPVHRVVKSSFFVGLIESILRFFENGTVDFDSAETLEVMRLRDAILRAEGQPDTWLTV